MAYTLADIRDEINSALGGRLSDEDSSWTSTDRNINLSMRRLSRLHDWKELYRSDSDPVVITSTPATDAIYTNLPDTLKEILALEVKESSEDYSRKLDRVSVRDWSELIGQSELHSTGTITHYLMFGRAPSQTEDKKSGVPTIQWFRVPSENYTLYRLYSVWPRDLSNPAHYPDLINKDDLIIADTLTYLFGRLGQPSTFWANSRQALLAEAMREDMNRPDVSITDRGISNRRTTGVDPWRDPFVRRSP